MNASRVRSRKVDQRPEATSRGGPERPPVAVRFGVRRTPNRTAIQSPARFIASRPAERASARRPTGRAGSRTATWRNPAREPRRCLHSGLLGTVPRAASGPGHSQRSVSAALRAWSTVLRVSSLPRADRSMGERGIRPPRFRDGVPRPGVRQALVRDRPRNRLVGRAGPRPHEPADTQSGTCPGPRTGPAERQWLREAGAPCSPTADCIPWCPTTPPSGRAPGARAGGAALGPGPTR